MGLDARKMENKTPGGMNHLALLLLCLVWLCCSEENRSPGTTPEAVGRLPDQESWQATIYLLEDDRHRVIVEAGHRVFFQTEQETRIDEGLTVQFFDENGVLSSTLTAAEGVIFEETRDMTVSGSVVIISPDRGKLETDSLSWIEDDNRITTRSRVRISTERDVITGIGFEADPNLDQWQILKDVEGTFDRGDALREQMNDSPNE